MQNKINQLSMMEQNIQNFALQKQQFQAQLLEIESAEKELKESKEAFKIIGNIMVSTDKETLKKDLSEKKETLKTRIESFDFREFALCVQLRYKASSSRNRRRLDRKRSI